VEAVKKLVYYYICGFSTAPATTKLRQVMQCIIVHKLALPWSLQSTNKAERERKQLGLSSAFLGPVDRLLILWKLQGKSAPITQCSEVSEQSSDSWTQQSTK